MVIAIMKKQVINPLKEYDAAQNCNLFDFPIMQVSGNTNLHEKDRRTLSIAT